jgi:hypothetical protein
MFTRKKERKNHKKRGVDTEITCSISNLDSISYIILDSTPPLSLPQIILVQTNTMKVALIPNPITVVTKLVPEPNISNYKNQHLLHKILQQKLNSSDTYPQVQRHKGGFEDKENTENIKDPC